jgi:hypothetical protein
MSKMTRALRITMSVSGNSVTIFILINKALITITDSVT